MKGDMITQGHLGGYTEGGDPATYYPALWDWLVTDLKIRSVIDVGCGDGHAMRHFERHRGVEVIGVDGCKQDHPKIIQHDYTKGALGSLSYGASTIIPRLCSMITRKKWVDLVWSCEFVEHLEEQYVPNFLATFACAKYVLMSHGLPGQPGHHHVNCRPADYWIGALAAIGYKHDETLTQVTRELAAQNTVPWNHYKRSGLVFVRY